MDRRVGNVVSFILRYWATNNSKPFPNGGGVPVPGTYVLLGRTRVLLLATPPYGRDLRVGGWKDMSYKANYITFLFVTLTYVTVTVT